jgi:hypothetical protein
VTDEAGPLVDFASQGGDDDVSGLSPGGVGRSHFEVPVPHASETGEKRLKPPVARFYGGPMNSSTGSETIAVPLQVVGMSFYFDPGTAERAGDLGLDVFQFYGVGRGGVLRRCRRGDGRRSLRLLSPQRHRVPSMTGRAKANPVETARAHVEAAYAFADRTFGAIDRLFSPPSRRPRRP